MKEFPIEKYRKQLQSVTPWEIQVIAKKTPKLAITVECTQ